MNIVLDMDQTLIDGWLGQRVTPRPHLKQFLQECFELFENVSIWTAASQGWYDYVYEHVFKDILESLGRDFHFVFTSNKCNNVWRFSEWHGQSVRHTEKRLRKLHRYKSEKFLGYCMDNTIIVDDTQSTFKCNYGNGIQIPPFNDYVRGWENDKELSRLLVYIRNVVIPHYEKYRTILDLEKRYWGTYVTTLQQEEQGKTSESQDQQ